MFLKIGDRHFSLLAELFLGNISIEEIQTLILTEKLILQTLHPQYSCWRLGLESICDAT